MMATQTKLNHRKFRALLKKTRRKRIRQKTAKERDKLQAEKEALAEASPTFQKRAAEEERERVLQEEYDERERQRQHRLWLGREELAQQEFQAKKLLEQECQRRKKEAQEALDAAEAARKSDADKEKANKNRKEVKPWTWLVVTIAASAPGGGTWRPTGRLGTLYLFLLHNIRHWRKSFLAGEDGPGLGALCIGGRGGNALSHPYLNIRCT